MLGSNDKTLCGWPLTTGELKQLRSGKQNTCNCKKVSRKIRIIQPSSKDDGNKGKGIFLMDKIEVFGKALNKPKVHQVLVPQFQNHLGVFLLVYLQYLQLSFLTLALFSYTFEDEEIF